AVAWDFNERRRARKTAAMRVSVGFVISHPCCVSAASSPRAMRSGCSAKDVPCLRGTLWPDAEGPDDQRHSLDEEEDAEDEGHRKRCCRRRTQQQNADEQVEEAEDERPNAASREAADDS